MSLGIKEVTLFTFSIENFKRAKREVDHLMSLLNKQICEILAVPGVKLQYFGKFDLLPEYMQKTISRTMQLTKHNNVITLNIALAYSSREEITDAIQTIIKAYEKGELKHEDLDYTLIGKCMYTAENSPVDIVIRTSGERRYSDFLLWQVCNFP